MKQSLIVMMASLATACLAKPHNHRRHGHNVVRHAQHQHDKRRIHTEWKIETVWVTETVYIDPPTPTAYQDPDDYQHDVPVITNVPDIPGFPDVPDVPDIPDIPAPPYPFPEEKPKVKKPEDKPHTPTPADEAPKPDNGTQPANATDSSITGSGAIHGDIRKGDLTFYDIGLGSCGYDDSGKDYSDTEYIVAVSHLVMGEQSWGNHWCDKRVTITAPNGNSITGIIRDKCMGCKAGDVDVSRSAFLALYGDLEGGRLPVTWQVHDD